MNNILLAFLTGLTTGGVSCFAVQGGLLASNLATIDKNSHNKAIFIFLVSKLVSYTILGMILGIAGSKLAFSLTLHGWMQILAGLFMIITAGKLLDLHPIFRKFTLTPPKSIYRLLKSKSLDESMFSSGLLGALTVLIPCGVTQAMIILSIASGSALNGGLIMAAFIMGTSPVFFMMGLASGEILKMKSLKILASGAIFVLGIISVNTGQILHGSPHTLGNYFEAAMSNEKSETGPFAQISNSGKQEVEINVRSDGYTASVKNIKAGIPVTLKLKTENVFSCARSFVIPEYKISKVLPVNGITDIEFTPTKKGRLSFACSMGMYTGYFNVI